jgi:putative oxidoreductase
MNRIQSIGLLILRVSIGSMFLLGHGWSKLMSFDSKFHSFPNPLGMGSELSWILIVFAEVVCSVAIILGFKTRWAAIPPFIGMMVAVLVVHAADPWAKKEFALLYAVPFLTLLFTGGGAYSIDEIFKKSSPKKKGTSKSNG